MPTQHSVRVRWAVTIVVIVLVALVVLRWKQGTHADAAVLIESEVLPTDPATSPAATTRVPPAVPSATPALIAVDVIGAVQQPGVYHVPQTARVVGAVDAAGGLAPDADREQINLAAPISDGQQVRVPRVGEGAAGAAAQSSGTSGGLVNINTADATALEALPGIGPATAQKIIEHREANGPFASVDALQDVPGLGAGTVDKFRDQVTTGP